MLKTDFVKPRFVEDEGEQTRTYPQEYSAPRNSSQVLVQDATNGPITAVHPVGAGGALAAATVGMGSSFMSALWTNKELVVLVIIIVILIVYIVSKLWNSEPAAQQSPPQAHQGPPPQAPQQQVATNSAAQLPQQTQPQRPAPPQIDRAAIEERKKRLERALQKSSRGAAQSATHDVDSGELAKALSDDEDSANCEEVAQPPSDEEQADEAQEGEQ
jgi:type IV secretory pathway VirB10-like protein